MLLLFWSLLAPAIDYAQADYGKLAWLPTAIGFLLGGFSLRLIDALVPHFALWEKMFQRQKGFNRRKKLSKTALLFLAITIHNFPEGLAVGVTFGALAFGNMTNAALIGAIGLAIGIGLQNIPEGAALSIPIRADGSSRWHAFLYGSNVCDCRTYRCCFRSSSCYCHATNHPICSCLCGWCYDFLLLSKNLFQSRKTTVIPILPHLDL